MKESMSIITRPTRKARANRTIRQEKERPLYGFNAYGRSALLELSCPKSPEIKKTKTKDNCTKKGSCGRESTLQTTYEKENPRTKYFYARGVVTGASFCFRRHASFTFAHSKGRKYLIRPTNEPPKSIIVTVAQDIGV